MVRGSMLILRYVRASGQDGEFYGHEGVGRPCGGRKWTAVLVNVAL